MKEFFKSRTMVTIAIDSIYYEIYLKCSVYPNEKKIHIINFTIKLSQRRTIKVIPERNYDFFQYVLKRKFKGKVCIQRLYQIHFEPLHILNFLRNYFKALCTKKMFTFLNDYIRYLQNI